MKFADIEWSVLRGALIGFGIALAVSGASVSASQYYVNHLAQENSQFQAALNQIRNRYVEAIHERQLIDQYLPAYRKLENAGFIGEENRLNWVDVLRAMATKHRVLALTYDVQPRAPVVPDADINVGEFQLLGSEMTLRMNVLHEGNALDLLRDLAEQNAGVFNLKSCVIERLEPDIVLNGSASNVTAQCRLVWHTIKIDGVQS